MVVLLIVALLGGIFYHFLLGSNLGNGYEYIIGREENLYIRKNNEIIIAPTLLDINVISNYVVGIRLPAQYLECEEGSAYKVRVSNKKEYFILSTKSGDVLNFSSRNIFERELEKLNLLNKISLDYSKFESVWERYSNYYKNTDFSNCRQIK